MWRDNFRIKSKIFEDLARVDGSFRGVFYFKFILILLFIVILDLLYNL